MANTSKNGIFTSIACLGAIAAGVLIGVFFGGGGVSDDVKKGRALRSTKIRRIGPPKGVNSGKSVVRVKESAGARPFAIEDLPEALQFKSDSAKEEIVSVIEELSSFLEGDDSKKSEVDLKGVAALHRALEVNDARKVAHCLQTLAGSRNKYVREVAAVAANWLAGNAVGVSGLAEIAGQAGSSAGNGGVQGGSTQGGGTQGGSTRGGGRTGSGDAEVAEVAEGETSLDDLKAEMKKFLQQQNEMLEMESKLNECGSDAERISLAKSAMLKSADENECNFYSSVIMNCSDKSAAAAALNELSNSGSEACRQAAKDGLSWVRD